MYSPITEPAHAKESHDGRGDARAAVEVKADPLRSRLGMGRKLHLLSAASRAPVAGGESARRTSSRFPAGNRAGALPAPALHDCRLDDAAAGTPPPAPHQLHPACPHAASPPPPADRWPGEPAAGLLGRLGRGSPPRAAWTCCCPAATTAGEKVLVLLIARVRPLLFSPPRRPVAEHALIRMGFASAR